MNYRQNLSSAAAGGGAPKVRAAEDNTAERCADACVLLRFAELHFAVACAFLSKPIFGGWGGAPKVRAAEDNTAERCAGACVATH